MNSRLLAVIIASTPAVYLLAWCFGLIQAAPVGADSPSKLTMCECHLGKTSWECSCGTLFGEERQLTLAAANRIATGRWRNDASPSSVWVGEMTEAGSHNWPVEIELYEKGEGILRSESGWFPVVNFNQTAVALHFEIDTLHPVAPNDLDREIITRAAAILSNESAWNRSDTRTCAQTDTKWSIYCATWRATQEVTGGFHHRRPALEVVRQIVYERSAGRNYHHRLMDYNNDPSTTLNDVQTLFAEALARSKH